MLRSMTGFGRWVLEDQDWTQTWEIKSVNNRFLDVKWRLPGLVRGLEPRLEKVVRTFAQRGRLDIILTLQRRELGQDLIFNRTEATARLDALASLASNNGDVYEPDYNALLSISELWQSSELDPEESLEVRLFEGLEAAMLDWNESRECEGTALGEDLQARFKKMSGWAAQLQARAPDIKTERFLQVKTRLQEVLQEHQQDLDDSRFLQEIVILSDKLDVSEELVRLYTHLSRLQELLGMGPDVGRRLDFTLQECFREIATCGNKLQDAQLAHLVVDFKNELEKCREQVQNLE